MGQKYVNMEETNIFLIGIIELRLQKELELRFGMNLFLKNLCQIIIMQMEKNWLMPTVIQNHIN